MYEQLKQDGIAHGMCKQFRDEWQNPTFEELCWMFFRGLDFCIEQDWPKVETLKEMFDPQALAGQGIHIVDGQSVGQSNVCIMGDADVHVYVPERKTCDIYARHNSRVHIHLGVGAYCYVTSHDNARVFVEEKLDGARLKASKFGGHLIGDQYDIIYDKTNKEG